MKPLLPSKHVVNALSYIRLAWQCVCGYVFELWVSIRCQLTMIWKEAFPCLSQFLFILGGCGWSTKAVYVYGHALYSLIIFCLLSSECLSAARNPFVSSFPFQKPLLLINFFYTFRTLTKQRFKVCDKKMLVCVRNMEDC